MHAIKPCYNSPMKNNRSEHTANLALGHAPIVKISPLCKVGANFNKPGKNVGYNKPTLIQRLIKVIK